MTPGVALHVFMILSCCVLTVMMLPLGVVITLIYIFAVASGGLDERK